MVQKKKHPRQVIIIRATDDETSEIKEIDTRERAEILLGAKRDAEILKSQSANDGITLLQLIKAIVAYYDDGNHKTVFNAINIELRQILDLIERDAQCKR